MTGLISERHKEVTSQSRWGTVGDRGWAQEGEWGTDPTGGENTEPEAVAPAPDARLGW